MQHSKISKSVFPVILMSMLVMFLAVPLHAQKATKISGKISGQFVKGEQLSIGDNPDHVVDLTQWAGVNHGTENSSFMDGAKFVEESFYDMVKGNGNGQGYTTFISGADTTIVKWEGKIITTSEAQAAPKHEGTWKYIYGTGKYKGISGSGTYNGISTSDKSFEVNWQGNYTLGK